LNRLDVDRTDRTAFGQGCGVGVGVSLLKETPIAGPIFLSGLNVICCNLFDVCAIYFTTKTVCTRLCTFY